MTDPDFVEAQQQFIGSAFGDGRFGAGVYGGAQILYGDDEVPQNTNWTETDE